MMMMQFQRDRESLLPPRGGGLGEESLDKQQPSSSSKQSPQPAAVDWTPESSAQSVSLSALVSPDSTGLRLFSPECVFLVSLLGNMSTTSGKN